MGYTNSSMVCFTKISPHRNSPRNKPINKITIHHMAGNLSVETCGNVFQSREASSHYGIGSDGRVGMYCEEKDRPWTSSSPSNDHQAVTIEVANCGGGPDWPVSAKAYDTLINLCVDICKRNGISKLNYTGDSNGNLTRHNMFAATSCPGPYLQARFSQIASAVNVKLGATPAPDPTPPTDKVNVGDIIDFLGGNHYGSSNSITSGGNVGPGKAKLTRMYNGRHPYHVVHINGDSDVYGWVDASQIKQLQSAPAPEPPKPTPPPKKSNDEIAKEVINGKWGNGQDRRNRLSDAGYDPGTIQDIVNRMLGGSSSTPPKKSNKDIAKEVIRGDWGNGQDRKNRLKAAGYDPSAIQDLVNSML